MTFNEIAIVAQYAAYYSTIDDHARAVEIYGRLYRNITSKYADDVVKARMYSTILLNYSTCLGRMGRLSEALAIIIEGENFARNHGRLTLLPSLAFNRGYALLMMGKKEESIPYFALSYFGTSLFSQHKKADFLPTIRKFVKDKLMIEFV